MKKKLYQKKNNQRHAKTEEHDETTSISMK